MTQLLNVIRTTQETAPAVVGMPATLVLYTDRHACTVVEVSKSGRTITLRRDTAKRTDANGMSECQSYDYTPNPDGATHTARLGKFGWRVGGRQGMKVLLGVREEYRDFSF